MGKYVRYPVAVFVFCLISQIFVGINAIYFIVSFREQFSDYRNLANSSPPPHFEGYFTILIKYWILIGIFQFLLVAVVFEMLFRGSKKSNATA